MFYAILLQNLTSGENMFEVLKYYRTYASSKKTIWFLAQERLHKSSFMTMFCVSPVLFRLTTFPKQAHKILLIFRQKTL
jgi:hypothetical protein